MRLRFTAPIQSGVALFVFIGGMELAGVVQSQDGRRCLECAVNGNAAGRSVQASLFTSSDSWTIHKRVDEVTVFFTATDRRRFVQGLHQDDIRVTDDGKVVKRISAFGAQSDLPLRLGLLVDTSASVNHRFHFEQHASVQFLRQVVRPGRDQAFVLGFANDTDVTQDYVMILNSSLSAWPLCTTAAARRSSMPSRKPVTN
jgi:hypothetical protein